MKEVAQTVGIGTRLKEERVNRSLSQKDAGNLSGVSREMWGKYEKGAIPGGEVLLALAEAGFDVLYILTGHRPPTSAVNSNECELLTLYRQCNADGQTAVTNVLRLISSLNQGKPQ